MQLTIDRDYNSVTINGTAHQVDCTSVQPEITIVLWFDDHGEIHFRDGKVTGLGDVMRFKAVIDLWNEKQQALRTR